MDEGTNGQVYYELKSDNNKTFRIDREFGWLFVAKQLDREQKSIYNLTVISSDGVLKSEWPFQLIVRDVNDNAPTFDKSSYSLVLKEKDVQIGQKLLRLNVNVSFQFY